MNTTATSLGLLGSVAVIGALSVWGVNDLNAGARSGKPSTAEASPPAAGQWVSVGTGPINDGPSSTNPNSARVSSIAVDPRNASHWIIGVGNGGVWDTRDAGTTWSPITDEAPTLAVGAVAFAPGDPDIIYVGTGESAGAGFTHVGVGILKSTNGGQTWGLLGQSQFARASVRRLRVDPNDANLIVAATTRAGSGRDAGEATAAPPAFGILRSTDGGNTWTRTLAGQVTALEIDSTNFARQYAAIGDQRPGVFNDTLDAAPNGLYRSADRGITWSRVDGPWGTDFSSTRSTVGRIELAMAPSNPDLVYASMQIPPNGGSSATSLLGLFRTDDAWSNSPRWFKLSVNADGPDGYCGPSKCGYSHAISVDPSLPNRLYAGASDRGYWRCAGCGGAPTWTNLSGNKGIHSDLHAMAWAGNRLIIGNDGGVWSTGDAGATWQNHNRNLSTKMFYSADLHPSDGAFILAGFRDFTPSTYRPTTGWQVLQQASSGEWGEADVAISSAHPDTDWMAAWLYGVIQRTTDGGRTSQLANDGIDKNGSAFVAPVKKCPANDDVFVTGTNRMWRTNNFFNSATPTWSANSPADRDPSPNSLTAPGTILSIAYIEADRACNSYAYGTRGGGVRLTRDGGATWTDLDPTRTLPVRPINGFAFDPSNPNRLFTVVSSYDEETPNKPGHIFRTENALSSSPSWIRVGPPDLPFANTPFNVIAIDPRDTRMIYAGSDNGLWESTDGGGSWVKVGRESGLPPASVYDIKINPTTNRTVIFTYGRGAFELAR